MYHQQFKKEKNNLVTLKEFHHTPRASWGTIDQLHQGPRKYVLYEVSTTTFVTS